MFSCMAKELHSSIVPTAHIAVIPDGNRRYSQRVYSWIASLVTNKVVDSLQRLLDLEFGQRSVQELSIFAWSSENWSRPRRTS